MNNSSTYNEDNNFNDLVDTANIVGPFFEDLDSRCLSDKLLDNLTYDDNYELGNQKASKLSEDVLTANIPEICDTFLEAILNDQYCSIPSLACSITSDMSCINGPSDGQFQMNNSDSLVDPRFSSLDDIMDILEKDTLFFDRNREHSPNNLDECLSPDNLKIERVSEIKQYSQHRTSSGKRISIERDDLLSGEGSLSSHKRKKEEILSSPGEQKESIVDDVKTICHKPIAQPEPMRDTPNITPNLPVSQPIVKTKTCNTSKQRSNTLRMIPSTVSTKTRTTIKRPKTKSKQLRTPVSKEYKTEPPKDESQEENIPVFTTKRKQLGVAAAEIHCEPQPIVKRKTRYTSKLRKNTLRMIPSTVITQRKTEIKRPKTKSMLLRTLMSKEYKTAPLKHKSQEENIPVSITKRKQLVVAAAEIHREPQPIAKRETRYTSKLRKNTLRMIPSTVITKKKTEIISPKTKSKRLRTLVSKEYKTTQPKDEFKGKIIPVSIAEGKQFFVATAEMQPEPQPTVKIKTRYTSKLRKNTLRMIPRTVITKRKTEIKRPNMKSKQLRTLVSKDYKTTSPKDESQEENIPVSITKEKGLTVVAAEMHRDPYHRSQRELANLSTLQPVVKISTPYPNTLRESALHLKPGNTTTKRKVNKKKSKKDIAMNCQINATQCCLVGTLFKSAKLHEKSEDNKDRHRDSPHNTAAVLDVKRSHSAKTILQNEEDTTSILHDPSKMINSTQRDRRMVNSTTKPKIKSTKQNTIEGRKNNTRTSLLDPTHQKYMFKDKDSLSKDQSNRTNFLLDVQVKPSYFTEKGCLPSANPADDPLIDTKDERRFRERNKIAARKYRQKKKEHLLQIKQSLEDKLPPLELKQLETKLFESKIKIRHKVPEKRELNNKTEKKEKKLIRNRKAEVLASRRYRERQKMYIHQLESMLNGLGINAAPR